MQRAHGIGGFFLRAAHPVALGRWYAEGSAPGVGG
jgi:hypothetical protein